MNSQNTYNICSKGGVDYGNFEGDSPAHALAASHRAGGIKIKVGTGGELVFDPPEDADLAGGLDDWWITEIQTSTYGISFK